MGAFFGAVSHRDVALDVFFGVDYHSHLGTRRAGMVSCREGGGFKPDVEVLPDTLPNIVLYLDRIDSTEVMLDYEKRTVVTLDTLVPNWWGASRFAGQP